MKSWLMLSLVGMTGSCLNGSFCDLYTPVRYTEDVARYVVSNDREAAENNATNLELYGECS